MEKQEKAYKGVIEYFKNRIMAGELRPGEICNLINKSMFQQKF